MKTLEQQARELLERIGVDGVEKYTSGDLVELANLIGEKQYSPLGLKFDNIKIHVANEKAEVNLMLGNVLVTSSVDDVRFSSPPIQSTEFSLHIGGFTGKLSNENR